MQRTVEIVWQKFLQVIREGISEQSYKTWFVPIIPVSIYEQTLTIQVPSQFFYEWLEENYVHLLRKALDVSLGAESMLEYSIIVDSGTKRSDPIGFQVPPIHTSEIAKPDTPNAHVLNTPFENKDLDSLKLDSYLNANNNFDNFIEGDCNRLARAASIAVAQKPGITSFNPLMIYGGVGLGKTHLVQAIGNFIRNKHQSKHVLYVPSEKFTNQYINAIRENNMQEFTRFYMQVDVLILDDVQFLASKDRTQEAFFHIFNHLHQQNKQIIMTSDRPPRDLLGLQDRLLSRFKWGLTTDLQTPDLETRIAIIQKKLLRDGIVIDYEVIEYIAHSIDTNVRELEGVIVSLMARASLTRTDITIELARGALRNLVHDSEKEVTIDTIMESVIEVYKVKISDLKSKSRLREVVLPRQVAMFLAKEFTNLSLKSIGYHFGGRDHSTVIHAIQTINDLKVTDKEIEKILEKLSKKFRRN